LGWLSAPQWFEAAAGPGVSMLNMTPFVSMGEPIFPVSRGCAASAPGEFSGPSAIRRLLAAVRRAWGGLRRRSGGEALRFEGTEGTGAGRRVDEDATAEEAGSSSSFSNESEASAVSVLSRISRLLNEDNLVQKLRLGERGACVVLRSGSEVVASPTSPTCAEVVCTVCRDASCFSSGAVS